MSLYHVGSGWDSVAYDRDARGVFLVVVCGAGPTWFLATEAVEVTDESGKKVKFTDGIQNNITFSEQVDVYSRSHSSANFNFIVDLDAFPMDEVRRQGVLLETLKVDVYWTVAGVGHDMKQAFHLVSGTLSDPQVDVEGGVCSFGVEDVVLDMIENDRPFPPLVATDGKIAALNDEDHGKVYPVVFGTVKKMPVVEISGGAGTDFLIADDRLGDYGASAVSALYVGDGADIYGAGAQAQATDSDGNTYWSATPAAAAGTDRDVTADVTGHSASTPGEIVREMITHYSDRSDVVDMSSMARLEDAFRGVTMSLAINERVDGGVFEVVRSRIANVVPFTVHQRGGKLRFLPLTWDRQPVKTLSRSRNIIRKASPPKETSKRNVFNSFTALFNRSGYRGDHQGAVTRDHDDDHLCKISKDLVGARPFSDINAGDLSDEASANIVIDWLVETHSKIRVSVAYECSLDVVDVHLWDVVEMDDEDEGWDHSPLFKVVGKTYTTGGTIVLSLLSVDDYMEVYNVNRWA